MVDEFVDARRGDDSFPPVVFVYQGTVDQGPMFFDRFDPTAAAIADPDGALFAALGIRRGGLREMFGWRTWRAGIRATLRGHVVNRKIGDPWTLPTALAIRGGDIIAEHVGDHAGDHPDVAAIPAELDRIGAAA